MTKERRDSIKIRVEQKDYDVVGGSFQELLAVVRNLPERRYVGEEKLWAIPGSLALVQGQLENSGFTLEGGTPVSEDKKPQTASFNDRIKLEVAGYPVAVVGDSFQNMLTAIKAIPGRRFDGESKQWNLPLNLVEAKAYFEKKGLRLEGMPENVDKAPPPSFSPTPQPPPPPPPDMPPIPDDIDYLEEEVFDGDIDFDAFFPPRQSATPPLPAPSPPPPSPPKAQPTAASGRRDQIKVIVGNQPLAVVGGAFREMLDAVKGIPDRRFDGETKQWLLPDDIGSIQQHLNAKGFRLEER